MLHHKCHVFNERGYSLGHHRLTKLIMRQDASTSGWVTSLSFPISTGGGENRRQEKTKRQASNQTDDTVSICQTQYINLKLLYSHDKRTCTALSIYVSC